MHTEKSVLGLANLKPENFCMAGQNVTHGQPDLQYISLHKNTQETNSGSELWVIKSLETCIP
jgi:hypothetical protein